MCNLKTTLMNNNSIEKLDNLFKSYNYQTSKKSDKKVRIYTLRYGMYHAAEIILLDEEYDASKIKEEYSSLGYATEVKKLTEGVEIEEYLFEGFFIKTPLGNELKNRYSQFVNRQLDNLPEGSKYQYIKSSYDLLHQNEDGSLNENKSYNGVEDTPLIDKINQLISETNGALFIIIEAAAGFGKTCTANEVLNTFSSSESKKLPFFTELSRNREARVFKHILLNEIDEQFPTGIKQNIVVEQISKGRIPLIIDGFDELISKESNKEEVESMLTTIVDLLKGNAKIIITSRKTAIFNSDEFLNSIYESDNKFSLARFEIKEPTVQNWLNKERIDLIETSKFPVEQISNPVLLAYLRNIPIEKLKEYLKFNATNSIIDKYVDYLLKREQKRQNLKLNNETQLRIFRKLVRFMTEYDFTAESKDTIKDFIKEFNLKILRSSLKEYSAEEKPSIEDLVETLSNHAFLDRKPNGSIGIINDFIFGLLVGENLTKGKYQEHYSDFFNMLPQTFAQKAVQSYEVQCIERKKELWSVFNDNNFNYDIGFYFNLDYKFLRTFNREYNNLFLNDIDFNNLVFNGNTLFKQSGFSNVSFHNCEFNIDKFEDCSFHNCSFYNCSFSLSLKSKVFNDFGIFACTDNNDFIQNVSRKIELSDNSIKPKKQDLTELVVIRNFFHIGGIKPRIRKLSSIKSNLSEYSSSNLSKVLDTLKQKEYIFFKDDVGFVSKKGIQFYNQNKPK